MVQSRIESGEFADAQSVIEAVLIDAAKAQDIVDAWVINDVLPNLELNRNDPSRNNSVHETREYLKKHIAAQAKAKAA